MDENDENRTENDKLGKVMTNALNNSGLSESEVNDIISIFPNDCNLSEYVTRLQSSHLIRGLAFANYEALKCFHTTMTEHKSSNPMRSSTKKPLEISARYLISLLQSSSGSLLNDDPLESTKTQMRQFLKISSRQAAECPPSNPEALQESQTRDRVKRNIRNFLGNSAPQETLAEFTRKAEKPTRWISERQVNAVMKSVTTQTKRNDATDIASSGILPDIAVNCYFCPSATSNQEQQQTTERKCNYTFDPEVFGQVHVQRILPRDTSNEIRSHYVKFHNDENALQTKQGHAYLIRCHCCFSQIQAESDPKKASKLLQNLWSCCLSCQRGHFLRFHSDVFVSVLRDLRNHYSDAPDFIKLLECELLIRLEWKLDCCSGGIIKLVV